MHKGIKKRKTFFKKVFSLTMGLFLSVCSAAGLTGCAAQEPDKYPDKEALKIAIVNFYDSDNSVEFNQAVVNKVNEYLDNMNCEYKVEFSGITIKDENFKESDAYQNLKNADIVYATPSYVTKDDKVQMIDVLNALVEDGYAQKLDESLGEGLSQAASVIENYGFQLEEDVYSLPLNVQIPVSAGIKIEKELFEKSGFEPRALESFEDCEELFEKLSKADEERAFLFVDQSASTVGYIEIGYKTTKPAIMDYMKDYMFVSASTAIDLKTGKAVDVYDCEEISNYLKTMYSYSEKGYTTGTSKDSRAMFDIAVYPEPYMEKNGSDDEDSYYYVLPIGEMISGYTRETPVTGVCISSKTSHQDWAEEFLNLVYSNRDFRKTVMFGNTDMNVEEYLAYIEKNPRKGLNPTYSVPFTEMDEDLNNIYNYTDLEGNTLTMEEIYRAATEQAPDSMFCIDDVDFKSLEEMILTVDKKMEEILRDMPYIFADGGVLSETDPSTEETYINEDTIEKGLDSISKQMEESGGTKITESINKQLEN